MHYEFTGETKEFFGWTLRRIRATQDLPCGVSAGAIGGWIESEKNLADSAWVFDNAKVCGNAEVCGNADYIVFKNWWSSGRYFTWTRSNDKWAVGCFYGTGKELIGKAYRDSEKSGREYQRVVEYVEAIKKEIEA